MPIHSMQGSFELRMGNDAGEWYCRFSRVTPTRAGKAGADGKVCTYAGDLAMMVVSLMPSSAQLTQLRCVNQRWRNPASPKAEDEPTDAVNI